MAQLGQFDATKVAPIEPFEAIPAGWYNVMIEASEMKPAKTEGNFYLELTLKVLDGQYANRKLFPRLNLRNNNPEAQKIAYRELSAICYATGKMQITDSTELHNIPVKAKVKVRPADGQYEASNEIGGWKNINEQVGGAAAPAAAAPWANGAPAAAPVPPAAAPAGPVAWGGAPAAPAAPAPAPSAAPAWQPPAGQQPWAGAPTPTPAAPAAPAAPHPAQGATPAWMAAPSPAGAGAPPWGAPQQ